MSVVGGEVVSTVPSGVVSEEGVAVGCEVPSETTAGWEVPAAVVSDVGTDVALLVLFVEGVPAVGFLLG